VPKTIPLQYGSCVAALLLLTLELAGLGCSPRVAQPPGAPPAAGGSERLRPSTDSARVSFQLVHSDDSKRFPIEGVALWFNDGSGERMVPGPVLAVGGSDRPYMPNQGYYPTATTGRLRLRVQLLDRRDRRRGIDTLAVAELSVPLAPDTEWNIGVYVHPRRPVYNLGSPDHRVAVALRRLDPTVGPEELVLSASKNSISKPYIR
jgi:hypothetical protein